MHTTIYANAVHKALKIAARVPSAATAHRVIDTLERIITRLPEEDTANLPHICDAINALDLVARVSRTQGAGARIRCIDCIYGILDRVGISSQRL